MVCHHCKASAKKFGKDKFKQQRYHCVPCKKTFIEQQEKPLDNMRLSIDRALMVLQMLVEGVSIRSIERIIGVNRNTTMALLVLAGQKCDQLMKQKIKDVPVNDLELDEIWGFVGCKDKTIAAGICTEETFGSAWCFVAFERSSKMVLAWHLGRRTSEDTMIFTEKIDKATKGFFQVTSDGFGAYWDAVVYHLGTRVSFAQLIKHYSSGNGKGESRYSPGDFVEAVPVIRHGRPDKKKICTSHVERQNLNIRMGMRRMTRLTNAFSKKWDNLYWAYALYFAYYNFCRIHGTTRVTPAMEAGLTDHIWTLQELIANLSWGRDNPAYGRLEKQTLLRR